MRRKVVFFALVLSACGGSTQPAKPAEHIATVEVPESDDPGTGEKTEAPGPARGGGDTQGCAAQLRAGSDLSAAADERTLYDAGLAAERAGDLTTARKSYFELIQRYPSSKLIPLGYLAFGEMFSAEAEADPSKWDLAKAAYREVIKYPPPENVVYFYASARLGAAERSDPSSALSDFSRASEVTRLFPGSTCASVIAELARDGMVRAYADAGAPEKAWAFFRGKLGERDGAEALRALVKSYLASGKRSDACAAAKSGSAPDLIKEGCGP